MEVLVEKITDEPAGNVLGANAAATIPDPLKKKSCTLRFPMKSAQAVTSAAEANLISDLVHKIENLKKPDAIARLLELEASTRRPTSRSAAFSRSSRGESGSTPSPHSTNGLRKIRP